MKPFATVLEPATSLANKTGSWRTERPVYVKHLPPCNRACPAGENIQEWLSFVEEGKYEDAWREMVKNNPFPAAMGRVCYHPCEAVCNRQELDTTVAINSVEQFVGDMALEKGWKLPKAKKSSGKKVLVVGAGPAGLSAAYHLAMLGHAVTVQESYAKAGGMMRYGIPRYRLPRNILDAEIKRILDLGVDLKLNTKVSNLAEIMDKKLYDAVFLSVGAQVAKRTDFVVKNSARVLDAVEVLHNMETNPVQLGDRVVVYGGGNTAMDVARSAVRMGAKEVTIVYRRTRERMPAHAFEIEEAIEEKVKLKTLSTIQSDDGTKIMLAQMALDEHGDPKPTGKVESMEADCVVLALGQDAELGLLDGVKGAEIKHGVLQVDMRMMTGRKGLFAGGDMVPSERTVTIGIGHGKKAAKNIDAWLYGATFETEKHPLAAPDRLNTWYYEKTQRTTRPMLDVKHRTTTFDEIQSGLPADEAVFEASRCLSCGNCFECDNCYGSCPDNAIKKLGPGQKFEINYDYCKGCGICAAECPCGSIDMVPEEI